MYGFLLVNWKKSVAGDVLVFVNETCVLGYKQSEIVRLFQTIPVGMTVRLHVCRGYPLLFDPHDPQNNFVIQDAYSAPDDWPSRNGERPVDVGPPNGWWDFIFCKTVYFRFLILWLIWNQQLEFITRFFMQRKTI